MYLTALTPMHSLKTISLASCLLNLDMQISPAKCSVSGPGQFQTCPSAVQTSTMGLTQALGEDWDWDWELKDWHQKSWLETLMPQHLAAARQSLSDPDSPLLEAILLATGIVGAQLLPQLLPRLLLLLNFVYHFLIA